MTDRELEDFIKFGEENIVQNGYMVGGGWAKHAITIAKALRDRLAQPDSVRWERRPDGKVGLTNEPSKREWVGLTYEEVKKIVDLNTDVDYGYDIWCNGRAVARDVEAKLKEKNT